MMMVLGRKSEIPQIYKINTSNQYIRDHRQSWRRDISETLRGEHGTDRFPENVEYSLVDRLIFLKFLKLHARINIQETLTTQ